MLIVALLYVTVRSRGPLLVPTINLSRPKCISSGCVWISLYKRLREDTLCVRVSVRCRRTFWRRGRGCSATASAWQSSVPRRWRWVQLDRWTTTGRLFWIRAWRPLALRPAYDELAPSGWPSPAAAFTAVLPASQYCTHFYSCYICIIANLLFDEHGLAALRRIAM